MDLNTKLSQLKAGLPDHCKLIAVTKTQPAEIVRQAYDAGHRVFGENKVQELIPKYEAMPKDTEWHMIGHLQSNKVKYIAPFIHLVHSVDSIKLLEEINKQGNKINRIVPCLLQVHIATEETKFGFSEAELLQFISSTAIHKLVNIKLLGLMGMATFTDNHDKVRQEFRSLKNIFTKLKASTLPENVEMKELSMGMSGDYKIAIEEGSTLVRVGTAIFGSRG